MQIREMIEKETVGREGSSELCVSVALHNYAMLGLMHSLGYLSFRTPSRYLYAPHLINVCTSISAAMASMESNPLISTHKSSDSSLNIHLHPLVLLTISDYIARHTLRNLKSPIVGALLGQQNGRDITLEHAFECQMIQDNGQTILHQEWFKDRLQQYKDVHQDPPLELMGWFTLTSVSGPEALHVPIHEQILKLNETAVLLAFHPSSVLEGAAVGAKLPLTIYESLYESGEVGDRSMEIDGQDTQLDIRFRELPYSVETGEAEMISVDAVARGASNATAEDSTSVKKTDRGSDKGKGKAPQRPVGDEKGKATTSKDSKATDDSSFLSAEDEECKSPLPSSLIYPS